MNKSLVRELFSGPLDIVGDIHGEIDALRSLMSVLGYGPNGVHPSGRRLVFIGDLSDRGPDSPAVLERDQRALASMRGGDVKDANRQGSQQETGNCNGLGRQLS